MDSHDQANPAPTDEIPKWLRTLIGTPLALLGGIVTTLFALVLVLYIAARISGGPSNSNPFGFLVFWLMFGAAPLACGILLLEIAPTRKRFWWRGLLGVLLLFLITGLDGNFGPNNWHGLFRREKYSGADASALKQTLVTPHLEARIAKGKNVLWCGTFQLAWNEACRLTGGDLQFEIGNPTISVLNKHSFTRESLDDSCYIALAGFVKDGIHDKIRRAFEQKFHGAFKPRFIPDEDITKRSQGFVAYACLYKNLSFPLPFERLDETLKFGGVHVSAFGMGRFNASLEKIYPQVLILDYQNEDDFVIELKTKSDGDRLILAKLSPKFNLSDIVASVAKRIAAAHIETAATNDLLLVPRIKLDLTRKYSEIENLRLIPKGTNISKHLYLLSAVQNTVFEMSEKGVELKSEASMAFGCAKEQDPVPKHKMIFDKPFLILMQQRTAKSPYFAFWVDNSEALISWK
ncbi:MAG: serpin family protein [Limisphaerales bacterium]